MIANKQKPLVSIHCLAYNHKDYIAQAIDSFLMQKTNFDYEIVIAEDYSTDGTREIVFDYAKKHPDIIRVVTSGENVGMNQNSYRSLKTLRGKYTAFCEGDDYWIDPLKLQKQIDFLEENLDYGMVHTDLHEYNTVKKTWRKNIWTNKKLFQEGDLFSSLIIGRTTGIYTCTATIRRDILIDYLEDYIGLNLAMGDTFMWLVISAQSKVGYFSEPTAVRQLLPTSATQGLDYEKHKVFSDSGKKLLNYCSQKFQVDPEIITLAKKSYALRRLTLFQSYARKTEFKKEYSAFRNEYFELEAILLKIATLGKYPYYFSRIVSKMLIKLNIDFGSKVYRRLRKLGLMPS